MNVDFANKHFLVVDDFEKFRNVLKGIIQLSGGKYIDVASTGAEAIAKIKHTPYDVVLCDYHLGPGKNGQQVLEQIRHENLLPETSIFLMVTAEGGSELVMGAIEFQPDGYLVKPFNQAMLKSRISKIMHQKETLAPIYDAIRDDRIIIAIEMCQNLAQSHPSYASIINRIEADLLLQAGDYLGAQDIYNTILNQRYVPWAALGLAKVEFKLEKYNDCINTLKELVATNKLQLQAYDILAQSYMKLGQPTEAINTLKRAISLSPKTILRHVELGSICLDTGDYDLAEDAFREAVKLGRNSCFKSADNYISFAKSTQPKLGSDNQGVVKSAAEETFEYLSEVQSEYKNDRDVTIKAKLMEARSYSQMQDETNAKATMEMAESLIREYPGELPKAIRVEIIEAMANLGDSTQALEAALQLSAECKDDPDIINRLDPYIEGSPLNNTGMDLYKSGQYLDAADVFAQACKEFPKSITFNLNAIQAIVKAMEKDGKSRELVKRCDAHFAAIEDIPPTDQRYQRYQGLLRLYKSME